MVSEVIGMLLQFRVKNYRSIGDEITIDLTAGNGRELSTSLIEKNKVTILPVISLYGSNASGKSNIIDAMLDMFANIIESHRYDEKHGLLTTPFLYDTNLRNTPTEFEMFFTIEKHEYQYGFTCTPDRIHEEWLYKKLLSVNDTILHTIFERSGDRIEFSTKYKYFDKLIDLVGEKNLALSFLAHQKNTKAKIFRDIYNWSGNVFFTSVSWHDDELCAEIYKKNEHLKNAFLDFIHDFDPLLEDIDIVDEVNKDGETKYRIKVMHSNNWYPLDIESAGTKKLFDIFIAIYASLETNGQSVFICDELDALLHPLILRRIVNMFHDKEVNKMGSQLIFTTHNTIVLDRHELRRDEIWFVEKNSKGFTTAYSLDSFKTTDKQMRADMSYGKHYLAGRFGAVPYASPKGDI